MFEEKLKTVRETYEQKHAELVAAQRDEFKKVVDEFIDAAIAAEAGNYRPTRSLFISRNLNFNAPPQPETKKLAIDNGLELRSDGNHVYVEGYLFF